DVLLIFGLAGRRQHICIETRARNARSILFPDINGWRPERTVIDPGRGASVGNGPFPGLLNRFRRVRLPARYSHDPGTRLCNYAYWRALQGARGGRPLVQFVHIPWVRATSRRAKSLRSVLAFSRVVAAGENLLIVLVAASRRSNAPPIASPPSSGSARPRHR